MDPDMTLAEIARLTREVERECEAGNRDNARHALSALSEASEALAEWLDRGGFLPTV